jgi:hypothetical protein
MFDMIKTVNYEFFVKINNPLLKLEKHCNSPITIIIKGKYKLLEVALKQH